MNNFSTTFFNLMKCQIKTLSVPRTIMFMVVIAATCCLSGCDDSDSGQRPETPKQRLAKAELKGPPKKALKTPEEASAFLSDLEEEEQ